MAKNNTPTKKFFGNNDFAKAIQEAVDIYLERDDLGDNCVNAYSLSLEKDVWKDFPKLHPERLRLMIMTAVSTDTVPGLSSRRGKSGGIYRTKAKAVRKPASKKTGKAANETSAPAATNTTATETTEVKSA